MLQPDRILRNEWFLGVEKPSDLVNYAARFLDLARNIKNEALIFEESKVWSAPIV